MSLDSLLDGSIDDIADLPEFAVYPAGAHRVIVNFQEKEVNGKSAVEMKMALVQTIEQTDPTAQALEPGAETSVLYSLDNEFGQGKFKAVIKVLAAHHNTTSARATMEASNGMEVVVLTKVRANKEKTQNYTDVVELTVE